MVKKINIKTSSHTEFIDITEKVRQVIKDENFKEVNDRSLQLL